MRSGVIKQDGSVCSCIWRGGIAQEEKSLSDGSAMNVLLTRAGVTPGSRWLSALVGEEGLLIPFPAYNKQCAAGQHGRKQLIQRDGTYSRQNHARDMAAY